MEHVFKGNFITVSKSCLHSNVRSREDKSWNVLHPSWIASSLPSSGIYRLCIFFTWFIFLCDVRKREFRRIVVYIVKLGRALPFRSVRSVFTASPTRWGCKVTLSFSSVGNALCIIQRPLLFIKQITRCSLHLPRPIPFRLFVYFSVHLPSPFLLPLFPSQPKATKSSAAFQIAYKRAWSTRVLQAFSDDSCFLTTLPIPLSACFLSHIQPTRCLIPRNISAIF